MELRENLSQVGSKDDPLTELDEIIDDVKSRINQVIKGLAQVFQQLLPADKQEPQQISTSQEKQLLKEAKVQVLKMQFLNRLQEECLNKEEDLADLL